MELDSVWEGNFSGDAYGLLPIESVIIVLGKSFYPRVAPWRGWTQNLLTSRSADTNILVSHLPLLTSFITLLRKNNAFGAPNIVFLIPVIVIKELDGLKHSSKLIPLPGPPPPDGEDSFHHSIHSPKFPQLGREITVLVSELARKATDWLLKWLKDESGVVRGQRLHETSLEDPGKAPRNMVPDDMILECCLYFDRLRGPGRIILFSNDKNLTLKATVENIPCISSQKGLTASELLRNISSQLASAPLPLPVVSTNSHTPTRRTPSPVRQLSPVQSTRPPPPTQHTPCRNGHESPIPAVPSHISFEQIDHHGFGTPQRLQQGIFEQTSSYADDDVSMDLDDDRPLAHTNTSCHHTPPSPNPEHGHTVPSSHPLRAGGNRTPSSLSELHSTIVQELSSLLPFPIYHHLVVNWATDEETLEYLLNRTLNWKTMDVYESFTFMEERWMEAFQSLYQDGSARSPNASRWSPAVSLGSSNPMKIRRSLPNLRQSLSPSLTKSSEAGGWGRHRWNELLDDLERVLCQGRLLEFEVDGVRVSAQARILVQRWRDWLHGLIFEDR